MAGATPYALAKARVNASCEAYPASTATSINGADVVTMRYAARSRRIRRRNVCGGSPATEAIIRSKWNREKWNLRARSSPDAVTWSSSASVRWSTKSAKTSVAVLMGPIVR